MSTIYYTEMYKETFCGFVKIDEFIKLHLHCCHKTMILQFWKSHKSCLSNIFCGKSTQEFCMQKCKCETINPSLSNSTNTQNF